MRRESVGLMVRAPNPVATTPGITDCRFAEFCPGNRGDRGIVPPTGKCSEPMLVSGDRVAWLTLGGGPTDLALEALELVELRVGSPKINLAPSSIEDLPAEGMFLSMLVVKLGRRRAVFRAPYSDSNTPGPTDFRGGLAMLLFETGG